MQTRLTARPITLPAVDFTVSVTPATHLAEVGDTFTFNCALEPAELLGKLVPSLEWYQEGENQISLLKLDIGDFGKTITVSGIKRSDAGELICSARATLEDGKVIERTAVGVLRVKGWMDGR